MKVRFLMISLLAWAGAMVVLFRGASPVVSSQAAQARRTRLEVALHVVEANFGSLMETGYGPRRTATGAAIELVNLMTAAESAPLPEELGEQAARLAALVPKTEYVLFEPTAPWQIVLVPDDRTHIVRVEAYGTDLEEPMLARTLSVPAY
jgi:hypothetical protein